LRRVFAAADDALGILLKTVTADDYVVVASMHGMGTNVTDLPSMVLLPELLHRAFVGRPFLRTSASEAPGAVPEVDPRLRWDDVVERTLPRRVLPRARAVARRTLPPRIMRALHRRRGTLIDDFDAGVVDPGLFGRAVPAESQAWRAREGPHRASVDWQIATRYRSRWPSMPVFALPSFEGGLVRLNVAGRERNGVIPSAEYDAWCDRVERLLREVVNPATGAPVVADVERVGMSGRPRRPAADLIVTWNGPIYAFAHPSVGVIGPYPPRRTGGHEDPVGFAYVAGPGIAAQDLGLREATSVAATVSALLGCGGRDVAGEPLVQPAVRPV
jgi:hypothetical protein